MAQQPDPDAATDAPPARTDGSGDPDADPAADLAPADVVGTTVEQRLLFSDGRYHVTVPARLADALGLENGDAMAYLPRLERGSVVFDVRRGANPDAGHVRRLHRPREPAHLRFPKEMAHERGFPALLEEHGDDVLVEIEVADQDTLTLRPWPESRPWTPAGGFDLADASRKRKRLVTEKSGPGTEFEQYRLYYPAAFAERYGFAGGERVAFRLAAHDGALGVAILMPTPTYAFDRDAPFTRAVIRDDAVGPADGEERPDGATYTQYRTDFPRVWADALDLRGRSLVLEAGPGFVFAHRS